MRIITRRRLVEFWSVHDQAESALLGWYKVVRRANWKAFGDVRRTYPTADAVGDCIVFNVGGNNIRLIAAVHYQKQKRDGTWTRGRVFVRNVLTHAEDDKGAWKKNCGA